MPTVILTSTKPDAPGGVPEYCRSIVAGCGKAGFKVGHATFEEWQSGAYANDPARDMVIATNQDAIRVPEQYAVIAVQHGSAMQNGLANRYEAHVKMGAEQLLAARRPRTFWVSVSEYSAFMCRYHSGVRAHRIIHAAVDTERFHPSERQRLRNPDKPVVLCSAPDTQKGAEAVPRVAAELGAAFEVRNLVGVSASDMPGELRKGDIFLSLSLDEGLPTIVQEAMATDLVVVGTWTGLLWSHAEGIPLYCRDEAAAAWAKKETGTVAFAPELRERAGWVADFVRAAWRHNAHLHGREYALRWFGTELFGKKWVECIALAARELGLTT